MVADQEKTKLDEKISDQNMEGVENSTTGEGLKETKMEADRCDIQVQLPKNAEANVSISSVTI